MSSGSSCVERLDLVLAMLELRCRLRTCSWLEGSRDVVVVLSIGVGVREDWVEESVEEVAVGGLMVLLPGSGWDSAPAIFSTLIRCAPSEESWAGVLPAVDSVVDIDGSIVASESFGSVVSVVAFEMSELSSGVESVAPAAVAAVGVALKLFFRPAFAAASAPACLMAIVNGESVPVLDSLSLSVEFCLSFGSEIEM